MLDGAYKKKITRHYKYFYPLHNLGAGHSRISLVNNFVAPCITHTHPIDIEKELHFYYLKTKKKVNCKQVQMQETKQTFI